MVGNLNTASRCSTILLMHNMSDINLPETVRTVAVYGGTFDPPTRAHVTMPQAVVDVIDADWLLVIPAAASPFKPGGAHATNAQRQRMLELAYEEQPCATISAIELLRGGASFTVDTLRSLHQRFPEITFRLIIGADQAASFHRWHEADSIITLAEPAVMLRGSENGDALLASMEPHWDAEAIARWRSRIVHAPQIDASSTEARALLGLPGADELRLEELLSEKVLGYIRQEGLYGSTH